MDRILDRAADIVGDGIFCVGYGAGRIAPKVRRACRAIADTRPCRFVSANFMEGFETGEVVCLQKEAEAIARKQMAAAGEAAREVATKFLAGIHQMLNPREERG